MTGYERLLLAYPRAYRRRHGTEILTTLHELGGRPSAAEAWYLVAGGLRQRFRLPARRPFAVVAAVLVALIGGAFGAAAGSWLGARTFADLPDKAAFTAIVQQSSAGGVRYSDLSDADPSRHESAYVQAGRSWDGEQIRRQLAADGWTVGPLSVTGGTEVLATTTVTNQVVPTGLFTVVEHRLTGDRHGLRLQITGTIGDPTMVEVNVWPHRTAAYLPSIAAGALAGLIAGWLIASAVATRVRHAARRPRRAVTAQVTAAVLTLGIPATALYLQTIDVFRYAGMPGPVHTVLLAGHVFVHGHSWPVLMPALIGVLLALSIAIPLGDEPQPETSTA